MMKIISSMPLYEWRSMFWTLLVTRVVRARSYETIHLIGTHCDAPTAYIHEVMN